MTLKKQLIHFFKFIYFMTFEHLSHFLILSSLSSLHMNDVEEGCAHLRKILNRMKLKYMECPYME